jgi:hypothetical protein
MRKPGVAGFTGGAGAEAATGGTGRAGSAAGAGDAAAAGDGDAAGGGGVAAGDAGDGEGAGGGGGGLGTVPAQLSTTASGVSRAFRSEGGAGAGWTSRVTTGLSAERSPPDTARAAASLRIGRHDAAVSGFTPLRRRALPTSANP